MRRYFLLILFIISCPRYDLKKIPETVRINTARKVYRDDPLYAYILLKDIDSPMYNREKAEILLRIYLSQREYKKAANLLDSIPGLKNLTPFERNMIYLKTGRWQKILEFSSDNLARAIACYQLGDYSQALKLFSSDSGIVDYRLLYQARCLYWLKEYRKALEILFLRDSVVDYLNNDYQSMIFQCLLKIEDLNMIKNMANRLRKKSLQEYVLLRIYEKKGGRKKIDEIGWNIIKKYPKSSGAYYALSLLRPRTKRQFKLFGKVCYYHNDYKKAIKYFRKAKKDSETNYYLGKIYYRKKDYKKALKYFSRSRRPSSYYYRGRIYEEMTLNKKAMDIYDSLYYLYPRNSYAVRGLKRKAFLLEDIGDTLQAVATFLSLNEKNTKFRAAMQLYRLGDLTAALKILKEYETPDFLYWRIRVKERLSEPVDSLKKYLQEKYPLSYYTLLKEKHSIPVDTISIDAWIDALDSSMVMFQSSDSLHIRRALKYFSLNEYRYGEKELDKIESKNCAELLYLSELCAKFGADKRSIIYALRLMRSAERKGRKRIPEGLLKRLYPVRYVVTAYEEKADISLCLAMIWQESLFDPVAVSPAQANGLMQIIPQTARLIARELNIEDYSLFDPATSIKFGWYYFSRLMHEFQSVPLSLAGYNAGPIRVRRWLKENSDAETDQFIELIPFNETRNYVKSVLSREIIYRFFLIQS